MDRLTLNWWRHKTQFSIWRGICGVLGALGLAGFLFQTLNAKWDSRGDFNHLFEAATAWARGVIPYGHLTPAFSMSDGLSSAYLQWYYYPPLCTVLVAPLTALRYPNAVFVWKILIAATLVAALWKYLAWAAPEWPAPVRLGFLGLTALSGGMHWVMASLQPTGLVVAFLLFFSCAASRNRWVPAILLAVLVSIKPTFFLPVICVFLFRRRLDLLCLTCGVIVVLNIAATYPPGPQATFRAYTQTLSSFNQTYLDYHRQEPSTPHSVSAPNSVAASNRKLPVGPKGLSSNPAAKEAAMTESSPWWNSELLNIDYLLVGWTANTALLTGLAWAFKVSVLGWFAWLWKRTAHTLLPEQRDFQSLLLGASLSFSLLAVYHQHYDAIAIFPTLVSGLQRLQARSRDGVAWMVVVSGVMLGFVLRHQMLVFWLHSVAGRFGLAMLVPVCSYLTMSIFVGAVIFLGRCTVRPECRDQIGEKPPMPVAA